MTNTYALSYFWRIFLLLALLAGLSSRTMAESVETQSIHHAPTHIDTFSPIVRERRETRYSRPGRIVSYPSRSRFSFSPITPPIKVEIAFPNKNAVILEEYLSIQGTAFLNSDNSSQLDRIEIQITNGTLFLEEEDGFTKKPVWLKAYGTDDWSYTSAISISSFPPGDYKITVKAFDINRNVGKKSIPVNINGVTTAYTELSLFPSSPTILQNAPLSVTGQLTRLPHFAGIDLSDNTITLEIIAPDGKSEQKETKTDKLGNYHFTNLQNFTHKGAYTLKSSFVGNNSLFLSESISKTILVDSLAGYAVLVQGKLTNHEGLKSHNKTLNRVYQKLKNRGFVRDNIRYFNYKTKQDIDRDGANDIFTSPNKSDIQSTIETWACERIKGSPAPFYLIMVDHGSPNQFHIDKETITPTELNVWLDNLETCLVGVSEPRVVILGSCYSGSFIPTLSKKGRIIIASASEDEASYKGNQEADNIRSGEFFIETLFQQLSYPYSIKDAFEIATENTEKFTHRGHLLPNKKHRFLDNAVQHPLLDDNGDGIGSNVLTANGDGNKIASLIFGVGAGNDYQVSQDNRIEILNITPPQYLTEKEDDTSALLVLQANAPDKVDPATIEIRPPSKILNQVQDSTEQIVIELETHFLKYNEDSELFEFTYTGFTESGQYDIFYTVRDKDTGKILPTEHSVVYKNRHGNLPPKPFQLISPVDNTITQTVLIFNWESTDDPDDEPITYSLTIAEDRNFNQIVYQDDELTHSMTFVDEGYLIVDETHEDEEHEIHLGLQDLTQYFWKVEAVDMYGAKISSDIHHFNTNNSNAPPGITSIEVNNALDGTPIENVEITIDQHQPEEIIADQGYYLFSLPPSINEAYSMWLTSPGYLPIRARAKPELIPLEIKTGQVTEIKVFLEPCTDSSCEQTTEIKGSSEPCTDCEEIQPAQESCTDCEEIQSASFSFDSKLLTIPTVEVPNVGDFAVQLQGDDSFTFTVLMDKLEPLSEANDYVAHFSFETGQLFLPRVTVIDESGSETQYKVTMKLVNPESLQFTLADAVEIQ
ncbi:secreted protein [Beggiatoa sp. PS]|nr:secreted protein [Beggiatoa sp. PS]